MGGKKLIQICSAPHLLKMYLQQVKNISRIQTVVTESVQQFHLSPRWKSLKRSFSKWVRLPLFQFPPVADNVVKVTAESLRAKWYSRIIITICLVHSTLSGIFCVGTHTDSP